MLEAMAAPDYGQELTTLRQEYEQLRVLPPSSVGVETVTRLRGMI